MHKQAGGLDSASGLGPSLAASALGSRLRRSLLTSAWLQVPTVPHPSTPLVMPHLADSGARLTAHGQGSHLLRGVRVVCPQPERHWWILVPLQETWPSFLKEEPRRESVFCVVHMEFLCSVAGLYLLRRKSEMVGSRSVPYRRFSPEPSLPTSQGPTGTAGHRQSLAT